jgi:hypothetical protein
MQAQKCVLDDFLGISSVAGNPVGQGKHRRAEIDESPIKSLGISAFWARRVCHIASSAYFHDISVVRAALTQASSIRDLSEPRHASGPKRDGGAQLFNHQLPRRRDEMDAAPVRSGTPDGIAEREFTKTWRTAADVTFLPHAVSFASE